MDLERFSFQISNHPLDTNQKSCHWTSTHTFKDTSNLSESSPFASYWQRMERFSPETGQRVHRCITAWCPEVCLSPIWLLVTFPFKEWMFFFSTLNCQSPSNHLSLTGLSSSFSFPLLRTAKAPEELMCHTERQQSCDHGYSENKSQERRWAERNQWKT